MSKPFRETSHPTLPKLNTPRPVDDEWQRIRLSSDISSPTSPGLRRSSFTNHLKPGHRAPQDVRDRSRNGYQNMLIQALQEFQSRPMPPSVFDSARTFGDEGHTNVLGVIVESVKGAVKPREYPDGPQKYRIPDEYQDDVDYKDSEFDTKQTHHLLTNMSTIIKQSDEADAYVFNDGPHPDIQTRDPPLGKSASPFRRSRNSLSPSGRRTRSPSPGVTDRTTQGSELLAEFITLLASVVSEDCRYKYYPISLLHPPNSLQALVLDIARFLLSRHRHDAKLVSQLGAAFVPAFGTFGREMHVRLLAFFEEVVISVLEHMEKWLNTSQFDKPLDNSSGGEVQLSSQIPTVSIQVEEVRDDVDPDSTPRWVPWTPPSSLLYSLSSTDAPSHSLSIYYASSLLSDILASVLDVIDIRPESQARLETIHRLYRLVGLITRTKHDVYIDLLQITASQSHRARFAAVSLLTTIWPGAIGHTFLSGPFPIASYFQTTKITVGPYDHQFSPWCFRAGTMQSLPCLSRNDCHACSKPIREFGLYCSHCSCIVHFGCYDYPDGCHLAEHHSSDNANVQRLAMYRFSDLLPSRRDVSPPSVQVGGHVFRHTNLFTLSLCALCRMPLWGSFAQCMRCISCTTLVHPSCLHERSGGLTSCHASALDSGSLVIDWTDLRRSCIDYYDILSLRPDELAHKCYEELDVFLSMLWIQKQLLDNGVAMGTVVVRQRSKVLPQHEAAMLDAFELHNIIASCEDLIAAKSLPVSPALDEYLGSNQLQPSQFLVTCEWSSLLYISSAIKTPRIVERPSSGLTLNIPLAEELATDSPVHPKEIVSLAHMRDILGYDFNLFSDTAAKYVLALLHHLGFFKEIHSKANIFAAKPEVTFCIFPLPLELDLSTDVETLFSSVETSLIDLDLSINEFGFLLLTKKLWPNSLMSEYALTRLCRSVLCWILAEDTCLATILKDYIAKRRRLPGVRSPSDATPWPSTLNIRQVPNNAVGNGGDYIATRRAMLARYANRWLWALHDQNPQQYALTLYQVAHDLSEEESLSMSLAGEIELGQRSVAFICDRTLSYIAGFSKASVTFTVFDDVFVYWLESLLQQGVHDQAMPSLSRLLPREVDATLRPSAVQDGYPDLLNLPIDPWKVVITHASESRPGLSRSLRWLDVFARSGIEIPVLTLGTTCECILKFDASFEDSFLLVKTALFSLWLRSLGRQSLQRVLAMVLRKFTPKVLDNLERRRDVDLSIRFLRYSLAACLILYGCDRQAVVSLGFIDHRDYVDLPSRRRLATRAEEVSDPIIIDTEIMEAIALCMRADIDAISCHIIKFLQAFLTESPLLESYEIDNFILRNGSLLCSCAWKSYGIVQPSDFSSLRPAFLLRTLVVDEEPLQRLLDDIFQPSTGWNSRLDAVTRAFRIILDVLNGSFSVDGRQWRSCVIKIFQVFFSALWVEDKEEIRVAVQSMCSTLLPSHLSAVTRCWDEALAKAPVSERVGLISFLIQLHPHFPEWQLLSWDVVIETLTELDYTEKNGDDEDGPASAHLSMYGFHSEGGLSSTGFDDVMTALRTGILLLSLRMISDGANADQHTLSKLKLFLAQAIGFTNVSVTPHGDAHGFDVAFEEVKVVKNQSYPCLNELASLLDSPHKVLRATSAGGPQRSSSADLVGATFSDVLIIAFCTISDLSTIPVLVLKTMIEGLGILIHKQDLEDRRLKYLQQPLRKAISRLQDVLLEDGSYEVRQIALSVTQAFIKKCSSFMGNIVISSVETAAKLIAAQSHHGPNDLLVAQARSFLETTLSTYSNGLFVNICRRPMEEEFFVVVKQLTDASAKPSIRSLRELLLRDTLLKAVESDRLSFQQIVKNLQTYVYIVHHQDYSADLMQFAGQCLLHLARRASEWSADSLDPSPLLFIAAKLMQHNKLHSRDMFTYTENILRILLNRLEVDSVSLSQLIHVTSTLVKKTHQPSLPAGQTPPNSMVQLLFEILGDGLRLKSRVHPVAVASMLEVLMTPDLHGMTSLAKTHLFSFLGLVDSGLHFLSHYTWMNERAEKDFNASVAVARMILEASVLDRNIMTRLFEHVSERPTRNSLSVRGWNVMVLAAMSEPTGAWEHMVFTQISAFSTMHQAALLGLVQSGGPAPQHAKTEVNYAYISIKLWLLLVHKVSLRTQVDRIAWLSIWDQLWSPFATLVSIMEVETSGGSLDTLGLVVWNLVADLLLFVNSLRCPLGAALSPIVALLERLQSSGQASTSSTKLIRALRSISEPPPEPALEVLVSQASKDIIAEEKIRSLWERENSERKGVQDRHR